MKIISKYKDFYDYIVQDYDADIHYVREPKAFSNDDKETNDIVLNVNKLIDNVFSSKHKSYLPYYYRNGYYGRSLNNDIAGHISIVSATFGIYPYVYKVPIIRVADPKIYSSINGLYYVMSNAVVDKIMCAPTHDEGVEILINEVKRLTAINTDFDKNTKFVFDYKDIKRQINTNRGKEDIKDVFYLLGAPVFIHTSLDAIYEGTQYATMIDPHTAYLTNICFNELNMNILKYYYNDLADLNTYINIENFLWSIKQEPVAAPDNKTKIQAHGFDLKTSFRKM